MRVGFCCTRERRNSGGLLTRAAAALAPPQGTNAPPPAPPPAASAAAATVLSARGPLRGACVNTPPLQRSRGRKRCWRTVSLRLRAGLVRARCWRQHAVPLGQLLSSVCYMYAKTLRRQKRRPTPVVASQPADAERCAQRRIRMRSRAACARARCVAPTVVTCVCSAALLHAPRALRCAWSACASGLHAHEGREAARVLGGADLRQGSERAQRQQCGADTALLQQMASVRSG